MRELNLNNPTGNPPSVNSGSLTYRDAGAWIYRRGRSPVENIKPFAKRTMRPEVLNGIGGFGALVEISKKYREPVLVSGTDGVGTKLKLAFELNRHQHGRHRPGRHERQRHPARRTRRSSSIIGLRTGCGCRHRGHQGHRARSRTGRLRCLSARNRRDARHVSGREYDLAGFAVGVVEKASIISGANIKAGDAVIGLASNGAHSNGYSLVRKIIDTRKVDLKQRLDGKPLADRIMAPTRIYVKPLLALIKPLPSRHGDIRRRPAANGAAHRRKPWSRNCTARRGHLRCSTVRDAGGDARKDGIAPSIWASAWWSL